MIWRNNLPNFLSYFPRDDIDIVMWFMTIRRSREIYKTNEFFSLQIGNMLTAVKQVHNRAGVSN